MSISASQLAKSPGYVNFNSANFFTRDDFAVKAIPKWKAVLASMFGRIDDAKYDLQITVPLRLWGAYENLSTLFPSYALSAAGAIGQNIYVSGSTPLVIQAISALSGNPDTLTFTNAALTKLSNLYLGVDEDLFAADVEFTCILGDGMNPEAAGAYFIPTTTAYSAATAAFAKTNYKRQRFTAAWGAKTGFTSFVGQKGFQISWALETSDIMCDGFGCIGKSVRNFTAVARCIPIGPTLTQIAGNSGAYNYTGAAFGATQMGALLSANAADLVITGAASGPVITLKNAGMTDHGFVFGGDPLRNGEIAFKTTTGFSAGAPAAIASAA